MLPADVNQRFADPAQIGQCGHLSVDLHPVFAVARNHATDHKFCTRRKSHRSQLFLKRFIILDVKESFHRSGIHLRPNHFRCCPVS